MPLEVPYSPSNVVQYAAPTVGQTVAIDGLTDVMLIEPAGLLASLTVNMPTNIPNGKRITIASTQVVTTLTLGGAGNTILNAITAFAAAVPVEYTFRAANSSWYKTQ